MKRSLSVSAVKAKSSIIALLASCFVTAFAGTAHAYDYRAKFLQEAQWLVTQQVTTPGATFGGIIEGEDYATVVESDNTHEAVWIWCRYAELTGDYTTYLTNINNAWTYLNLNPAWLEGGTPTNYYTTYNIGWGLLAEMKYRHVYGDDPNHYVDHTSYGTQCADTLVNNTPGTSATTDALVLGIASGALYQYGVDVSSTTYKNRAVVLGGSVRTWLNGNTANFAAESWAVSGGIAVWGVLNSYYQDPAYASGAAAWAETANTYMPANAMNGSTNNYEYGMDGWYAWGHYALSQYRGADSFAKYINVMDKILASDNDHDGGIRQGLTYTDISDYAWATDIPQFAVNYGLIGTTNYTISGTVTSGGSPLAGVVIKGLPGTNLADANSSPTTDASGFYTTQVPAGFYGTATPTKVGYTFTPANITYSNLSSNQTGQNYTAATSDYVQILGSWTTGTTHAKETGGTDRALVFVAHTTNATSTPNLTAVTYGGQSMTKIIERNTGSGTTRAYVAAFILNDAGITAATNTTFAPTWTNAPTNITYSSVFLQDVSQGMPIGATAGNGLTGVYTVATTPIATSNGDIVIECAASSNTGTYLATTGWTNDIDLSATGYDGMGGHISAAGINEIPAITQGTKAAGTRTHSIIGFVVKVAVPEATNPNPAHLATGVSVTADLSWAAGSGATSHDVYFGTSSAPPFIQNQAGTTFDTGTLSNNTTYYWRIDEINANGTTTGDVWSFTTATATGMASSPSPANGATNVGVTQDVSWSAGSGATSHDVYFGTSSSPPFIQNQAGTTYDTGTMNFNTTYYWRIDEVGPGGTATGTVWSFTTARMIPTFVAAGAVANNTTAITPALPAGIQTGDILLLALEDANQVITIPTPNGGTWTQVTGSPQQTGPAGSTGATRLTVFWSRYNGTQGAPTTSDSGDHQTGRIIAIRNAATSGNPWDVTAGGVEATSDTSGAIPGATTTVSDTLIVAIIATDLPDASGTANFTGWTNADLTSIAERTDNTVTSGNGGGLGIATGSKSAAGTYANTAVTLAASAVKGMMTIAIKPDSPPSQAINPNPASGATGVSITADLSWTAGAGATSHDVYFGTSSPGTFQGNQAGATFDPGTLSNNTTYYWRIDEKNVGGTTTGTVWSFTTVSGVTQRTLTSSSTTGGDVTTPGEGAFQYNNGTVVNIVATPNANYHFVNWTGTAVDAGKVASPTSASTNVTMDGDYTVVANFAIDTHTVTFIEGAHGSITGTLVQVVAHGGNCTAVNAVANPNYHFTGWTGSYTGSNNPLAITNVTADMTITANFAIDTFTLTYSAGTGGTISGTSPQTVDYGANGTAVTAVPNTGWHFVNWSDASTANPRTDLGVTANIAVTANFAQTEYTLTVNVVGNGSVAKSPDQATYHYGDTVTLTPTADAGWTFGSWTGTGGTVTIDDNETVTATFTQNEYTLTVNVVGSGSVAKSPDQATYHYGDTVTLTPTADAGWTFGTWTGTSGTVTIDENETVTATFTQNEYTLTVNIVGSGSVAKSPDQTTYHYGDTVTLTPTADAGWTFGTWTGTSGTVTIDENETVTATFTQNEYTLTVNIVGNGSVAKSPDQATYHYGDTVTLTPTADAGWTFGSWTGTSGTVTIDENETVTATFTQNEYTLTVNVAGNGSVAKSPDQATYHYGDTVTLTPTADAGWTFGTWTGTSGTVTIDENETVTATFTQNEYTLTVNVVGSGSVAKSPDQATYHYGDTVTLTPTADAGWTFGTWTGTSGTVTIDDNETVTATFTQNEYTLTVNVAGNGSVAKSPDQATYHYGDTVTLTPTADAGWTFGSWTGTSGTVTIDDNETVTATFTQNEYTLTVNVVGNGSVAKSPDQATYHYGDTVTLTPTADAGWTFGSWTGTSGTVTIDDNETVTATFTQNEYTLTVNVAGNGSVAKSPDQATYHYGDTVTLTPTADAGWTFGSWTGTSGTVTIDDNETVTATFTQNEYTLTVNIVGSGSVAKTPDQATYHYGDTVTLTPTADAGWTFGTWTGTSGTVTIDDNETVTATFTQNEYTLTVNVAGNGSVAKSPDQATYHYGDTVTLTPTADAGWTFGSWSGDTTTGTITMDANKSVTANFSIDTFTLEYSAGAGGSLTGDASQVVNYNESGTAVTAVPNTGYHFVQWSDGVLTASRTDLNITANISVTANFAIDTFTLEYSAGAGGSLTGDASQVVNYNESGTAVTAVPNTGYHFVNWSDASTDNPRTDLGVTANIAVTANFAQTEYTLTVNVAGNGSVAKSPDQTTYHYGDTVTLTPTADAGWTFGTWTGTSGTVTIDENETVTATFTQNEYTLTVNIVGSGSVAKTPDQATYHYGDTVTLTPTADAGWTFGSWSGDTTTGTITMDANKSVTANFSIDTFTLEYSAGAGGSLTGDASQVVNYNESGTAVTAVPNTGYHFVQWSDGVLTASRTDLNITANISVTANFAIDTFTLEYSAGAGGSLTGDASQVVNYNESGTAVTAVPNTGYHFVNWSDASTDNPRTDLGVTANIAVTANFAQTEYTLTVNVAGNGSVAKSPDQTTYHYGDTVTLTPTADAGWTFGSWTGTSGTVTIDENETVTATFTQNEYTLTVNVAGNGSVAKSPDQATYHYGDTVTLTPTADAGWTFGTWTGTSGTVTIDENETVTATFTQNEYTLTVNVAGNGSVAKSPDQATYHYGDTVTLTPTADAGWTFGTWTGTGGTVTIDDNETVTATFTQNEYTLTVNVVGSGSVAKSPDQATYHYGDTVTLTPTADTGWTFGTWTGTSGTVTIDENETVTATFTQNEYTLTVNIVGSGSVAKSPDQTTYHYGDTVTLTPTADAGWTFGTWTGTSGTVTIDENETVTATFTQNEYTLTVNIVGNGSVAKSPDQATYHYGDTVTLTPTADAGWTFGSWTGTSGTVTIDENETVTATFTQNEYTLTVNVAGNGSVAKSPDQATYHYGDTVTLTPTADAGWTFGTWTGTSGTVTIDENETVTATFTQNEYTLTVNVVGSGSVAKSPDQATYHYGDTVTLTPTADAGWTFGTWTGTSGTVTIDDNETVTATFTQNEYTLTVNVAGNGSVAKSPDQATYHYGDTVTLTPTADAGWTFGSWTGTSGTVTIDDNETVTATFTQNEYTLTVNVAGNGSVAKSPDQATYHYGDTVTLTPTADAGWTFGSWTGTSGTVTIDDNETVTATFTQNEYTLTVNIVGSGSVAKTPDQATYHYGDTVTLTPTADAGWTFGTWTGTSGTVTIDDNETVTATFTQNEYTLTVNVAGNGSVAKSPDQATYHYGDTVTLTPTADAGWTFGSWSGDTTTGTITMDANKSVTANFSIDTFTLEYSAGAGGSLTGDASQVVNYNESGTAVTAVPNTGYHFVQWSDGVLTASRTDLNITANISVTANFAIDTFTLEYSAGAGGSLTGDASQVVNYNESGTAVTAVPNTGYHFVNWSDASTDNPRTDLGVTANIAVTANFAQTEYTLTVNVAGNGSVAKSPDQTTYHYGDTVTLTPTADAGWTFGTWTGTSGTVTIDENETVTATFTQNEYTLTVNIVGSGSVAKSPDQTTYHYGDTVTLTPTADAGWTFGTWTGTSGTVTIDENETVTATFTQNEYTLTVNIVGNGSVAKSPDQATYHYGDTVTLTPTADAGWTFGSWTGTSGTVTIDENETVTATFTQNEYTLTVNVAGNGSVAKSPDQATYHYGDTVTLTPTADAGWTFGTWTGTSGTVTIDENETVTATFTQNEYTLTVNVVGSGSVAKSPDQATYHYGDTVTLTPTADAGWTFGTWTGTSGTVTIDDNETVTATFTQNEYTLTVNVAGNGSVAKSPDQATYHYGDTVTLTPTADAGWTFGSWTGTSGTVTIDDNETVTATFTQNEYTLTVNVVGNGSVAKSPDQATYHYGDTVTLTPTADAGWTFGSWTGTSGTVTIDDNETVTATFTQNEYTLTVNVAGNGSVAKSPDQATYHYGDTVTLTPTADAGWTFGSWTGTSGTVTIDDNETVTATFTQNEYTLTVNIVGSGSVAKTPDQATYHYGDTVTLTPTADAGWTFGTWTGTSGTVTIDDNETVTATFTMLTYIITASAGTNGSIDPVGGITIDYGTSQLFTATPDTGYEVDTWFVDSIEVQAGGTEYTLSDIMAVHSVHVTFVRLVEDNFNDNRRGAMWRYHDDSNDSLWLIEDANVLNMQAAGELPLAGYCAGHWKMNDNSSTTTVIDSSGNGKTGTAQQNTSVLHTTGKIDGALTFNGTSDYVNIGNVIGTGAYTKVAWVKTDTGSYNNNIVASSNLSHAFWAPASRGSRLMAGHADPGPPDYDHVQDSVALQPGVWYQVAVTFDPNVDSGRMVLYKNGSEVDNATNVPTQTTSPAVYIGRFYNGYAFKGAIDNVMIFNRALTAQEIQALYNGGNGTETIPSGTPAYATAGYIANRWTLDTSGDFEVKVDYHYSGTSNRDGWVGMGIETNADNYVSLSAGHDSEGPFFYYEKAVGGSVTSGQIVRGSNDGTLYISYNASTDELYLSSTGYGSENAWQTISGLLQGQWASEAVSVTIDGGADRIMVGSGEANLDNFEVTTAILNGWPVVTDLNDDGYIDWEDVSLMAGNWLDTNPDAVGDVYDDDIVNFRDFAEIGLDW